MTPTPSPAERPRRRSLRYRMVATFLGLVLVPFCAALALVFVVARHDVSRIQGEALAQEARLLGDLLYTQIESAGRAAAAVASLSDVREHLAGRGPYPVKALSQARRFLPGVEDLQLAPADRPDGGAPVGPAEGSSGLGWGDTLEFRIGVTDLDGRWVGSVRLVYNLDRLQRLVLWYRSGEHGRAVLFTRQGQRLAGPADVPVPGTAIPAGWGSFDSGGQTYAAGVAPVDPAGTVAPDWLVAVVEPASALLAPFYFVTQQVTVLLVVLVLATVALAWRMADRFLKPILDIRHGAEIISRINLDHRIRVDTGDELEELAGVLNRMAETLATNYEELRNRVRETTRSLQEERNRLATVLRTMAEGVVVANEEGSIVLMNPRARLVLDKGPSSALGAPLSRVLPPDRIGFILRRLRKAWNEGQDTVVDAVFPLSDGTVLQGSVTAVPGPCGARAGFLLVFRDVSPGTEEARAEETLSELPELLRGPVGTARALLETLERHPDMPADKQREFRTALAEELDRLTERVQQMDAVASLRGRWHGSPIDPRDLVEETVLLSSGVYVDIQVPDERVPQVVVEPFTWAACVARVVRWLADRSSGWKPVSGSLRVEDQAVVTVLRVEGGVDADPAELETLEVAPAGERPFPLGLGVRRNRGELWTREVEGGFEVCLGLEPAVTGPRLVTAPGIADDQPEFYDFDLFLPRPSVEPQSRLDAPLADLEYVVFDTETTGLRPSEGDRVVSLSGVRIRGGRIQHAETFHALVNPGRPIPPESTVFHGITDADVAGAPPIGEVVSDFQRFVGDAILVAHNAAFDKRFLDIACREAGLPLIDNPILDTLFLSYGIHKEFQGHNLDAIAERLGVTVEGRHTSLGDARATAEVFLKLVSLLPERGVVTLKDAKTFCDRMLLLRWQSSRY